MSCERICACEVIVRHPRHEYGSRRQEDLKALVVAAHGFIGIHPVNRNVKEAAGLTMQWALING